MLLFLLACAQNNLKQDTHNQSDSASIEPEDNSIYEPASVRIWRLTDSQYRNVVRDVLDHSFTGQLPIDYDLHGYTSVGAADISVTPYDLELYEQAAWEIAEAVIPDDSARIAHMGCDVEPSPTEQLSSNVVLNHDCVESWLVPLVTELWRRPLKLEESEDLLSLFEGLHNEVSSTSAAQAVLAVGLLSPDFIYRIETGELGINESDHFPLSHYELASRLSFFLTDSSPDETLRMAAEDGVLKDGDELETQARRLLQTERAEDALVRFFSETLDLEKIHELEKNEALFPNDSPTLRTAMIEELEQLFLSVAIEGDFRKLLTSELAFLSPDLAELYGLANHNENGWAFLPETQGRGGLLGRAGFLALNSTAIRTSPTHRGKFIRTRLLCQDIPPPPEGVVASLEGVDQSSTLREQLEQHMSDPACNSCHVMMDPLGFPLEHFDALGMYRETDNGFPVDASGDLDGEGLEGAAELGAALAEHNRFSYCVSAQLMRHAIGTLEGSRQEPYAELLQNDFIASGYQFQELVISLVLSPVFRGTAGAFDGSECASEGDVRPCNTACGEGVETCLDGLWQACTAQPVAAEICDGVDQDCDGTVDQILRPCMADGMNGVEQCDEGQWSDCSVPTFNEVCDGIDNDLDGLIDENMNIELVTVSFDELQSFHNGCDPEFSGVTGPCNAAVNRFCATRGCGTISGFGFLAIDFDRELASVACLGSDEVVLKAVGFDTLALQHSYCLESEPVSADCNASINRFCSNLGLTSGFGPIEHSNGQAFVGCTPSAEVFPVSYDSLSEYQSDCYWPGNRHSDACNTAIFNWCFEQGFSSGYGPLENSNNIAYVACLPW
ncbi:MAG: DUF1592 domain-containing protein [Myxococcota bacterium]|nr:DUF1592 domain-containing protein [Myxococcota bacterium]